MRTRISVVSIFLFSAFLCESCNPVDEETRITAIRAALRDGRETVARRALADKAPIVRLEALVTMASRQFTGWAEAAEAGLNDSNRLVRISAESVLAKYKGSLDIRNARQALELGSRDERLMALGAIAYAGTSADFALLDRLSKSDEGIAIRTEATLARFTIESHEEKSPGRIGYFMHKLEDRRSWVRRWAADKLAWESGTQGLEALARFAKSGRSGNIEAQDALSWREIMIREGRHNNG